MKSKTPVLEYSLARKNGKRNRWVFKFRTPMGQTVIQSPKAYPSKAQAEAGFTALMKSVATNHYKVEYPRPH